MARKTPLPRWLLTGADWIYAQIVLTLLRTIRLLPTRFAVNTGGALARTLGPVFPVSRVGLDNIKKAFPEKSEAECRQILKGVWDNLGRTAVEYAFLDRIFDFDFENPDTGHFDVDGIDLFLEIANSDKPSIVVTGHTGNWELLPVCAATYGLQITVLFRPPNNAFLAEKLDQVRGAVMGGLVPSRKGALVALNGVMEKGGHVGLLVDQHFSRGKPITFFGRTARANPSFAKLARNHDADVYAARSIRLPEGRFRLELKGPLDLERDDSGKIAIEPAMQTVANLIEDWVREYPDQWLWLHRRWRG